MTDEELDLETGKGDGGDSGTGAKKTTTRTRGRPSNEVKTGELQGTIKEGLGELAEWLGGDLGDQLKDGAPRMAKVLSARAAKHARVARALGVVFAADGPLAILRAFGPFARALGDKVGAWRDRGPVQYVDADGYLVDQETGLRILDDTGQPIRGNSDS